MKKAYKNQIFHTLLNHPTGIDNFEFKDIDKTFTIIYNALPVSFEYAFILEDDSFDKFTTKATAYEPKYPFKYRNYSAGNFATSLGNFVDWIVNVLEKYIEDETTIDLWDDYKKRISLTSISNEEYENTTNFTIQEKDSIKLGLNEIKLLINQRFITENAQKQVIEDRLNYLTETLDRIDNKTDWKGILINTIISITIALSLDAQKGQELYNLFVQMLQLMPLINK